MKSTHLVKIERIVIFPRGVAAAIHGVVQVRLIGRVFSQTLDVESRVAARPRFQVDGFQRRQVAGVLLEQLQALGVVVCQRILAGIRRFLARVHHVCRKGAGGRRRFDGLFKATPSSVPASRQVNQRDKSWSMTSKGWAVT